MFHKRIVTAFALASLVGFAACGDSSDEEQVTAEPTAETSINGETPEVQVAPEVYEGATVMDTSNIAPATDSI